MPDETTICKFRYFLESHRLTEHLFELVAVHDSMVMDDLLHGEERTVHGDKAYVSQNRKGVFEAGGGCWRVNRK